LPEREENRRDRESEPGGLPSFPCMVKLLWEEKKGLGLEIYEERGTARSYYIPSKLNLYLELRSSLSTRKSGSIIAGHPGGYQPKPIGLDPGKNVLILSYLLLACDQRSRAPTKNAAALDRQWRNRKTDMDLFSGCYLPFPCCLL